VPGFFCIGQAEVRAQPCRLTKNDAPQPFEKTLLRPHCIRQTTINRIPSSDSSVFDRSILFVHQARREFIMRRNQLAVPILAFALAAPAFAIAQPLASPSAAFQDRDHDRDHDRDWDTPPQEFRDIQRQGFHDGIEGARKDYDNHRRPDVENRDEYRHPHVAPSARQDYREGFRRGYETAMDHLMNNHGVPHK
jgi:hypothetical protein